MKYQDMKNLTPYRVIKSSSDKTFLVGEIIWISPSGHINSIQSKGWIDPTDSDFDNEKTLDFEVEEAMDYEVIVSGGEICRKINVNV